MVTLVSNDNMNNHLSDYALIMNIEDAPAPSPLHSFKAYVADGKIHVTANPEFTLKENMGRPPKLSTAGFDAVGKGTVIIGGGSGAFQAVESLREVSRKQCRLWCLC